jgi:hypothetical protein
MRDRKNFDEATVTVAAQALMASVPDEAVPAALAVNQAHADAQNQTGPHVGDRELEVLAEPVGGGAFAVHPPVVDGGDRDAQIGRQLVDVHQRLEAPLVGGRRGWVVVVNAHTQKVRTTIPDDREGPKPTSAPRTTGPGQRLKSAQSDDVVMTQSNLLT